MVFFDPLTAGSLLVLAASSGASLCTPPGPAEINIVPKSEKVVYDYSRSLTDLQRQNIDTINPYGFDSVSRTSGFMEGSISMTPSARLGFRDYPERGATCIWYDTIDITIEIKPKIVLASEVYADRCMKKAVLDHEMKHVKVDRLIVNKYAKSMGRKVYDGLKQRGFSVGPVPIAQKQAIVQRMNKTVSQLIELEYQKMMIERTERQQEVDSLEEYQRVSAKCPKFDAGVAMTHGR